MTTHPASADRRQHPATGPRSLARKTLTTTAIVAVCALTLLFIGYTALAWLLFFAAVLLAILLRSVSDWLADRTHLPQSVALTVTVLALAIVATLLGWLLETRIETEINDLAAQLTEGMQQVRNFLQHRAWGRKLQVDEAQLREVLSAGGLVGNVRGLLSSSLGAVVNMLIVVAMAIYFAIDPRVYLRGLVHLLPFDQRNRARATFDTLGTTLRWWLVGRLCAMFEVGLLTGIGLWLLGVPLPFTLGVLTGLMNFVPNFGPVLATVVTGLVGLSVSPTIALYAVVVQTAIGLFDGFVVTPLIQQRTVSVPAGVILGGQVLIGILLGGLGVMLATPLIATLYVLVRSLYVRDMLGDETA